jgi:hypothetical protein
MDVDEFKSAWQSKGDKLVTFPANALVGCEIPDDAKKFLLNVGLPEDAAPCLSFGPTDQSRIPAGIRTSYLPVGSNGSGDPVVISEQGTIFYLNHDQGFQTAYVNKDIHVLAECLLRYRQLITESLDRNGPDAPIDWQVLADLKEGFKAFLMAIDAQTLSSDGMWAEELALM